MIIFFALGLFMMYIGGRCLYNYYKHGFYPPGDKGLYRNSAWTMFGLGAFIGGAALHAALTF